jgi:hypothetical protein
MAVSIADSAPFTSKKSAVAVGPRPSVTASQEIRVAAFVKRKARLARVVRVVVVACAMLCVAGIGSKVARAFGSGEAGAAVTSLRPATVARDLPATVDALVASVDSLSERTLRAMRVDERRAAARVKKATRSRYTW